MSYKLQFKDRGKKRYYDMPTRKLETRTEASSLKKRAEKDFPGRVFKIKKKWVHPINKKLILHSNAYRKPGRFGILTLYGRR